jgi:hypothetical protein
MMEEPMLGFACGSTQPTVCYSKIIEASASMLFCKNEKGEPKFAFFFTP